MTDVPASLSAPPDWAPERFLTRRPLKPSAWLWKKFSREEADWRAAGHAAPVREQRPCNSCTSHAFAVMFEAFNRRRNRVVSISAPFVHTCIAGMGCKNGFDPERLIPKLSGKSAPADEGSSPWDPARCGIGGAYTFDPVRALTTEEEVKRALRENSPVVVGMQFDRTFFDLATEWYTPSGPLAYDHAACIVGFNTQGWLVQNSFGSSWGDGRGFFRIKYGLCGIARDWGAWAVA